MTERQANEPGVKQPEVFDSIADRYERYVPWESRLAREIPFLEDQLRSAGARRVIDCACGPGRHAVALAQRNFEVTGFDVSPEMLSRARNHARDMNVEIALIEGRFEALPSKTHGQFDGLLCLGNALSAAEDSEIIRKIVCEFARALKPGGVAITQTVDFEVVVPERVKAAPVRAFHDENKELVFVKSFVRVEDRVFIHWVSLESKEDGWDSEVSCREVTAIEPDFLKNAFTEAGFSSVVVFGDYAGNPYENGKSRDLILVARR
jgi:ubiquinone/menaquinone biosynthesis C-methylase UbiE